MFEFDVRVPCAMLEPAALAPLHHITFDPLRRLSPDMRRDYIDGVTRDVTVSFARRRPAETVMSDSLARVGSAPTMHPAICNSRAFNLRCVLIECERRHAMNALRVRLRRKPFQTAAASTPFVNRLTDRGNMSRR